MVNPDNYLMLSGVQHFAFCERRWALVHIENQWQENYLTFRGKLMHKNVDNPFYHESRRDVIISRAVPLVSHSLKLYGIAETPEGKRRLRKVAKTCKDYGVRVQNSVFECVVDTVQLMELKSKIGEVICLECDSIRYYNMGNEGRRRVEHVGAKPALNVEDALIF